MLRNGAATFFALRVGDGTVFIGPAAALSFATGDWPDPDREFRGDLESALRAGAEMGLLRAATIAWGQTLGTPPTSDARLCFDVAEGVRTGRLAARFLPRFVDDPRGPDGGAAEPFRRHQLVGAFPAAKASVSSSPRAPSRSPPPLGPRPQVDKPATDFANETAQAEVLKKAAESGVPFCEICAANAAKMKAA